MEAGLVSALPPWAGIVAVVILGALGIFLSQYARKKENEKIVTTNPDELELRNLIIERERLQNSTTVPAESERGVIRTTRRD